MNLRLKNQNLRRTRDLLLPKLISGEVDIEHDGDRKVTWCISEKRHDNRIHIWLEEEDYVVVLADRNGYLLPWTAFSVTKNHTRLKLRKEYTVYWKNGL